MAKKTVRISEKALLLAKQQLMINEDANVTPDELITLLVMQNQETSENAQTILDYMGDEFAQKVNGQNKPRLTFTNHHFKEKNQTLHIDRLLKTIDRKPTDAGLSDLQEEIRALRDETNREHRRQANMFNVFFLSIRLMLAEIVGRVIPKSSDPADIVAKLTLSEKTNTVMKGVDAYSLEEIKNQAAQSQKQKGHYND